MKVQTQLGILLLVGLGVGSWDFFTRVHVQRDASARDLTWTNTGARVRWEGLQSALASVDRWLPAAETPVAAILVESDTDILPIPDADRPDEGDLGGLRIRLLAVFGGPAPFIVVSAQTPRHDQPDFFSLAPGESRDGLMVADIGAHSAVLTLGEDRLTLALFRPASANPVEREWGP